MARTLPLVQLSTYFLSSGSSNAIRLLWKWNATKAGARGVHSVAYFSIVNKPSLSVFFCIVCFRKIIIITRIHSITQTRVIRLLTQVIKFIGIRKMHFISLLQCLGCIGYFYNSEITEVRSWRHLQKSVVWRNKHSHINDVVFGLGTSWEISLGLTRVR